MIDLSQRYADATSFMLDIDCAICHGAKFKFVSSTYSYSDEVMTIMVTGMVDGRAIRMSRNIDKREVLSCRVDDAVRPHVDLIVSEMNDMARKLRAEDSK